MNKKSVTLLMIAVIFIAAFFVVRKIKKHIPPQINLTDISLTDLQGNKINLASYAGKPLIINFWASWCGPCRQEFPGYENARKKYEGKVNFLMASDEEVEKIMKFSAENNYGFSYVHLQKPFHDLGITSVPFTYLYDTKGTLVFRNNDVLDEAALNKMIDKMLDE